MHKNMHEIKSKDWAKMQAYFAWNKEEFDPALKAMKNYPEFDFHKMFLEDSSLFAFFIEIHKDINPKYDVKKFWDLRYKAYQHLKKDGILDIDLTALKIQLIKDFDSKVSGPCLISKDDLEDSMMEKKKKRETQYSCYYDYHQVLDLIESHYTVHVRGIFAPLQYSKQQEIYARYFSPETYGECQRISPVDSLEANYISIIYETIGEQIEYIDFWHHMLDDEFYSISNGCLANMYEPDEPTDVKIEDIIHNKNILQEYVSNQIKRVFFKELKQVSPIDENIEFLIEW